MKITGISVTNTLGLKDYRLEAGKVVEIRGRNGSGKSSILQSLQAALGGGNLANLQRVGTDDPAEIVLLLDDGRYRVTRRGDATKVEERVGDSAAYERVRKPQSWLDSLYDAQLSNPLRFLQAAAKDRADILLQVLPLNLSPEQVKGAVGEELWPVVAGVVGKGGHPLEVLTAARQTLYDTRTGVNVSARKMADTADQLKRSIPAEMPEASNAGVEALEKERDALAGAIEKAQAAAESEAKDAVSKAEAAYREVEADVSGTFKADAAKARKEHSERAAAWRAEVEKRIADDLAAVNVGIEKVRSAGEALLEQAEQALESARSEAVRRRDAALQAVGIDRGKLTQVADRLAQARARLESDAALRETKRLADKHEADAKSLAGQADRLSEGIQAVDLLKTQLLAALPIDGLEVQGKEIRINGVPFDQVNTASKVALAVKVASLRAKSQRLPVVFVDGAEALDSQTYALLVQELEAAGVQAFVASVDDSDLHVKAS